MTNSDQNSGATPPPEQPPIEVIDPTPSRELSPQSGVPNAPVHFLSSMATILLDWLWFTIELPETLSVVALPALLPTILSVGVVGFATVTMVQHYIAKDEWGPAAAKGLVMGIAAGVPYPVVGTIVGTPLLVWAGIHEAQKLLAPKTGRK